jgi:hypothetical protein
MLYFYSKRTIMAELLNYKEMAFCEGDEIVLRIIFKKRRKL